MIIPSKHSGYQAGIRLYPGGGGDSAGGGMDFGGSSGGAQGSQSNPDVQSGGSIFGTGYGAIFGPTNSGGFSGYADPSGAKYGGFDGGGGGYGDGGGGGGGGGGTVVKPTNTAGTSTIDPNNPALKAMRGQPYNEVGRYYNSLLQQGYAGNDIRNALTTKGEQGQPSRPVSDSDYEILVQNAGMTSPTGRPMAGSDQFTQPVYQQQYNNYTNPLTAFNVSSYGTNPGMSRSLQAATAPGAGGAGAYYKHLQGYGDLLSSQGDRNNINTLMQDMRQYGISAQDLQSAASYNPPSPFYGGGQQSMGMPNPFSYGENNYVDPYSGRSTGLANPTNYQQQQYNPFNYRQSQQQQYNPFSYQQPQQQYNPYQQQQYNPYQQQQYNPYQQQYNPFSYQQQDNLYQQPQPVVPTSSGPSQAIYGRSSAMRGTPNVMRRAEGGIAGILEK